MSNYHKRILILVQLLGEAPTEKGWQDIKHRLRPTTQQKVDRFWDLYHRQASAEQLNISGQEALLALEKELSSPQSKVGCPWKRK